jgi:hypothetical protein
MALKAITKRLTPQPAQHLRQSKLAANIPGASKPRGSHCPRGFLRLVSDGHTQPGEFFYNNLTAGKPVNGFTDMFFSPLYVAHLAEALLEMLQKRLSGIYHVYAPESLSKYDFGVRLAQEFGLDASLIRPISAWTLTCPPVDRST